MKVGEGAGNSDHLDPVCGRSVAQNPRMDLSAEYKKKRYYFCSESCRCTFERRTKALRMGELARAGALLSPGRVRWGMA
jgi:YHS domain-containing protein